MTVLAGGKAAILICDQCGREDPAEDVTRDSDLVWPLVTGSGWTGSPFATGAHRCPRCSFDQSQPASVAKPSPQPGASYDVRMIPDADMIVLSPQSGLDADLADRLRADLMDAATSHRHVVLDLHAVPYIDSAGLGLLVRARQEARQHDATFDLVAPSRFVQTVLHTMRLDAAFRTFADLDDVRSTRAVPRIRHHP